MIIVEGPDGSGKTTLCGRLVEEFEFEYMRYEGLSSTLGPKDSGIIDWWNEHIRIDHSRRSQRVFDRCFYISERIYQPASVKRKLMTDGPTMCHGLNRLWVVEPIIIFCLPPEEVTIANIQSDPAGQLNLTEEAFRKVYWSYWGEYALWKLMLEENILLYDYTNSVSRSDILDRVQEALGGDRGSAS